MHTCRGSVLPVSVTHRSQQERTMPSQTAQFPVPMNPLIQTKCTPKSGTHCPDFISNWCTRKVLQKVLSGARTNLAPPGTSSLVHVLRAVVRYQYRQSVYYVYHFSTT